MRPSRLRVALGTVYPYDESYVRGGVEAVALYLVKALAKRDDVGLHVVSCSPLVRGDFTEQRGRVTFHWLATSRRLYALRASTLDAIRVRRVYNRIRPDVIHAQGASEYALAASPADRLLLTIHGVEAFVPVMRRVPHYRGLVGKYRLLLTFHMVRRSIANASAIVSIAGDYVPGLFRPLLMGKRIYGIENPVDEAFFQCRDLRVDSSAIALSVGSVIPRKNLVGLLAAFETVVRELPNAQLRVAGAIADSEYFGKVQDQLHRSAITEHVHFLDSLGQESLLREYEGASLLVMSSIHETTPVVIAQAMAAGRPVVATRAGGTRAMIRDGDTGYLVDVGNTETLAQRMVNLLRDWPEQIRIGRAARQWAREHVVAGVVAAKTAAAYRELAGEHAG